MNRLIHPNGGMPFHSNDIDWVYDSIKEGLKGAVYASVLRYGGNAVLAGCDISFAAGQATITEGFVVIGYEVCYCPAQTVAVTSLAASSLKVSLSYDPAGLDVFADSVSRDTYEIRRAIISDGLNAGDEVVLENPMRVYYEYDLEPFLVGSWVKDTAELKAIVFNGQVQFKGSIKGGISNVQAFILPNYLAPSQIHFFVCPAINFVEDFIKVRVDNSNNVTAFTAGGGLTFTDPSALYLDGIRYTL